MTATLDIISGAADSASTPFRIHVCLSSMLSRMILLCCLAATLAIAADSDNASVIALIDRYATARDTPNPDRSSVEALFTKDADQLVSSGVWRRGREELVPGMMQSSRNNRGDRTITVESVRFLASDVAIADARYIIGERKMWSTFVVVKTTDGWRIGAIRNMKPAE
jgi:uncharacterized protein (TIGR02246 family)